MKYKYDIFISHSSKDKPIVRELGDRLITEGFSVWFDEWEIQVGEQIPQKISEGVETSRYVGIWLSVNSLKSHWVNEEWQAKYYSSINSSNTVLLPLLGEKCEIPTLLRPKKYADFTLSFEEGLSALLIVLNSNSSQTIEYCFHSLVDGKDDAPESAKKLGQIVLKKNDEVALMALWKSSVQTKKPFSIIDHIAYFYGRIMIEGTDSRIKTLGVEILKKSIAHESEIVVDKYAYVAGDIVLESTDAALKKEVINLIKGVLENGSQIAKERYMITKRRIEAIDSKILVNN